MHGLIEIHTWFYDYRQYLQWGKISGNFLLELNFQKIYNPSESNGYVTVDVM